MSKESLKALIARLRAELYDAHEIEEPTREALHRLADDIEQVVEQTGPEAHGLRDRITNRIREMEISHMKLTTTLSHIVDALATLNL